MNGNLATKLEILEDRRSFLGASDCASVLGMSRWKTPLQIWAEKTGAIEPEDISDRLQVKLGNRLEEVVAELFTEETGKKVRRVNDRFIHKQFPFLSCAIDRKVEGERAILQCKTASAWKAKEWEGEEIPHEYILQEVHELAATGYDRAYIAVLIGNQDFKMKIVERDEALIQDVVRREVEFWTKFVIPRIMPQTIKKDDAETLFKLFPNALEGEIITLPDMAAGIIEGIESMNQDLKNLEGIIDQQKNELKVLLKEAETGEVGRNIITWKNESNNRMDTDRLKKERPEIYEQYLNKGSKRVLRFRKKKEAV